MKNTEKIKVKTYSGFKADEKPSSIIFNEKEIKLKEVIPLGKIKDTVGSNRREFFAVTENDELLKLIQWDDESWSVLKYG
jgi:hypothetical protein